VCNLLTGVIQGSVLGPLIFLIYINDLVELLSRYNIKVKLFADDVKLYIKFVNEVDVVVFQEALTALFLGQRNGSCQWRLINVGCYKLVKVKCRLRSVLMTPHCLWLIHVARDLGVTISKDLSPSQYINDIVRKWHQRANLIIRCFVSQNVNLLVRAFVVYVRPLLEYNSSV